MCVSAVIVGWIATLQQSFHTSCVARECMLKRVGFDMFMIIQIRRRRRDHHDVVVNWLLSRKYCLSGETSELDIFERAVGHDVSTMHHYIRHVLCSQRVRKKQPFR